MKNKGLDDVIQKLVQLQEQVRVMHWQTTSYEKHMAFGKTYDDLGGLLDGFVEICTGKYGKFESSGTIQLINIADGKDLTSYLDGYVKILASLTDILDAKVDSDLLNIRDEILGIVNKLRYLLTLK